ncbi:carboxypeptidase-like regulatory domain-containing protein [Belliella kenyensis]|uniref:Carboxypeptidase-like regulatory domain-containing protein n=1 Tax=Belliella kenyensis TaxID=1472724 RepID=A0ABV8EQT1_9BACT|nr:carboxypeptidase-like regulatory domain-containing protein [Belliella kenyensis]MCH7403614.1 carboxypeptidase-like regulatory domain-containing protein [Belliella kenyensis]MDN3603834.1 carboxypeptidase-like regulatory domain-containing protein [Belliella kenyensis]
MSFFQQRLIGQTFISGKVVVQPTQQPMEFVNVLVKDPFSQATLNFDVTDDMGLFKIYVDKSSLDSILVMFRSMTIKDTLVSISNVSQELNVEVIPQIQELEEFSIKAVKNPISFKNDTLTYDLGSYTSPNDRLLSDVLKKLPGIEVDANGRIQYEGRSIQNFYIDGLNLLEGKYNLASNNLPIEALESVQVLENHQPIRVFDSLIFSDRTSLNIKLKRKNIWLGVASLGIGGSPFLYQGKLNPMIFGSDFQMINVVQANNTGQNLGVQLETLSLEDLKNMDMKMDLDPWAEISRIQLSNIPRERYLFNDSKLISSNALFKTKKDLEIRLIASLVRDANSEFSFSKSEFFLPIDTISIHEIVDNRFKRSSVDSEISFTKNVKDNFLKNNARVKISRLDDRGIINFNQRDIYQSGRMPLLQLENQFKTLIKIKGSLIDVNSFVGLVSKNQDFNLSANVFNTELDTDVLNSQRVVSQTMKTINSIGIVRKLSKSWTLSSQSGFHFQSERMDSMLEHETGIDTSNYSNRLSNDLSRLEFSPFVKSQFLFREKDWRVNLDAPIHYFNINVNGLSDTNQLKVSKLVFQPSIVVNYFITGKLSARLNINRQNNFQGIAQNYSGLILRNFRLLTIKNTAVPESISTKFGGALSYKNPIYSLFSTLAYNFSLDKRNTIAQNQILEGGINILSMIDQENFKKSHSWNMRVSKHFLELNTVATFSGFIQQSSFQQTLNSSLIDFSQLTFSPKIELSYSPKKYFALRNNFSLTSIQNSTNENTFPALLFLQIFSNIEFFPVENHSILVTWEHFGNKNSGNPNASFQNNFLNLVYQYKLDQKRLDFKFELLNLLNNNSFDTYNFDTFVLSTQSVLLRPRQVVFQVGFRF